MRPARVALWRSAAACFWIVSLVCLFKAISDGAAAEQSLSGAHLSSADAASARHLSVVADRWATAGWTMQLFAAMTLAAGLTAANRSRQILYAVCALVGVDGVALLLAAILVR